MRECFAARDCIGSQSHKVAVAVAATAVAVAAVAVAVTAVVVTTVCFKLISKDVLGRLPSLH